MVDNLLKFIILLNANSDFISFLVARDILN
jgi:hypothetical protein